VFNQEPFRVSDRRRIRNFVREHSLGLLISTSEDGRLHASSIPFLIDSECTELKGHMARMNEQWNNLDGRDVLVLFQGPGHYISPEWYGEEASVPTWNYVSVHVEGSFRLVEKEDRKMALLDEMVAHYEGGLGRSWSADWGDSRYRSMVEHIAAFTISIEKIEGKWKMSQNHTENGIKNVAGELLKVGTHDASRVSGMMLESLNSTRGEGA